MTPEIFPDHESMSRAAADWILTRVHGDTLLCLATGATPMRAYEFLARDGKERLAAARILKLDEWGGIPIDSPATCETFLRKTLIEPLRADHYEGFQSQPADPETECARVAKWLEQNGPIELCVLGLGINGHLGFNEPAEHLIPHAHVAKLSPESLSHSMLNGLPQLPTYGLTLGMADLLTAREILVVVSGASKQKVMKRLFTPDICNQFPASLLWLHPRVTILSDIAAAEGTTVCSIS